jgi:hypothetical protein
VALEHLAVPLSLVRWPWQDENWETVLVSSCRPLSPDLASLFVT